MPGQVAFFGWNDHNFCNDCITILDDTLNEFTFSNMLEYPHFTLRIVRSNDLVR